MSLLIETERLVLTQLAPDDASRVTRFALVNAEHHGRWSGDPPEGMFTDPFWRERIARGPDDLASDRGLTLWLVRREDPSGPIVGRVHFFDFIRSGLQLAHLGYAVDRACEGQGLMFEALSRALAFVFDDLRMHRVRASYAPENVRSGRLLRRLGFVVEGYSRDFFWARGRWHDQITTSLLNPDPAYVPPPPLAPKPPAA